MNLKPRGNTMKITAKDMLSLTKLVKKVNREEKARALCVQFKHKSELKVRTKLRTQ